MSGIDYSKWDRMQFSDEEEEEEKDRAVGPPRVTRLDQASQVTLNPNGQVAITASTTDTPSATAVSKSQSTTRNKELLESSGNNNTPSSAATTKPDEASTDLPSSWTEKGGCTRFHGTDIVWTQNRESVTLRVLIPAGQSTKGWCVKLHGRLSYADRHVGVGSKNGGAATLEISHAQHGVLLPRTALSHAIHKAQGDDDDDDNVADWTIERSHDRAHITVPLCKAAPMAGVVVWWNRPLEGAAEIDMAWRTADAATANFQKVWDQAHAQFRAKLEAEKND